MCLEMRDTNSVVTNLPNIANGSMSIAFRFFDCVNPVVCVHYYHCACLINVSNKSH